MEETLANAMGCGGMIWLDKGWGLGYDLVQQATQSAGSRALPEIAERISNFPEVSPR
jgi:hypothetical protein